MTTTSKSTTETPVPEETQQYYINSIMSAVENIRRKSFRRLILLKYVIEYESYERKGPAWNSWIEQKDETVDANPTNFVYALDVSLVREMQPSAIEFCAKDDVDFLYDVSDETLREYVRTVQSIVT